MPGLPQTGEVLKDWPESLIQEYEANRYVLSDWGELVWKRKKEDLLAGRLLDLPGLTYSKTFRDDFDKHDSRQNRVRLQETLANVSRLLEDNQGDVSALRRDGGLQFSGYKGRNEGVDHFRVSDGLRVSCRTTGNGLELLHFGEKEWFSNLYR